MLQDESRIIHVQIEDELQKRYIEYSMSVIVSRALPDVRDGLKPSQRRILYAMKELNLSPNKGFRKCAKIAGDTSGNYHPHGEQVVYPTLVRMAQPWNMRYPLINGQGNFGSIDGDPPAAMRYTEAKLFKTSMDLMEDLEKETVDYRANYDDTRKEPTVFPAKLPNLLINGSSGIAVGMATSIPPHNITEICNATKSLIDNPDLSPLDLMEIVKGPDFPTGGEIVGKAGILDYFQTGRGKIKLRGKTHIEENPKHNDYIVITEIPYQLNKTLLIEKIVSLVKEKRIEGISDIRDESGRQGMRLVIVVKKNSDPTIVLNHLYKFSQLQSTFSVINLALLNNAPRIFTLKEMIEQYIIFRHEVIVRRTKFELKNAEARLHILEGYRIALDNIDEIIKTIRASKNTEVARNKLMELFKLSEIQAKAILEMKLQKLTGLERDKIEHEYNEILKTVDRLREILAKKELRMEILKGEMDGLIAKYGDNRRTSIIEHTGDFEIEDLIEEQDMVVTISHEGYLKRLGLDTYRQQNRGGKGTNSTNLKENDFIETIFVASTHAYILFFTDMGKCYWLKVYEIPEVSRTARGKSIVNLLKLEKNENIKAFVTVRDFTDNKYVMMVSAAGIIKKTELSAFSRPRTTGIKAIKLLPGDELIDAQITNGTNDIILATRTGFSNRFSETEVRSMGRVARGVKGISLRKDDNVVAMVVLHREGSILAISENGFGKRSKPEQYNATHRGSKGVITLKTTKRNGHLVSLMEVQDSDDLMIVTKLGKIVRLSIGDMNTIGRNTQGVKLINLNVDDKVFDITLIKANDEEIIDDISDDKTKESIRKEK
jgi:DNA gyrase subunit A